MGSGARDRQHILLATHRDHEDSAAMTAVAIEPIDTSVEQTTSNRPDFTTMPKTLRTTRQLIADSSSNNTLWRAVHFHWRREGYREFIADQPASELQHTLVHCLNHLQQIRRDPLLHEHINIDAASFGTHHSGSDTSTPHRTSPPLLESRSPHPGGRRQLSKKQRS